jgi:ABC-type bacteriocin/lantibiotic exporter with double-glycine peptidase domain
MPQVITKTNAPWKRLFELLNLNKKEVSQLYVYATLSGFVGLSLPLGIQSVINFIQGGQISTSWIILVLLVILGIVLTGILQIMQLRLTENIQQRIFTRYSFDLADSFPRLNRLAMKNENPNELMNRFFDIVSLQKGIAKVLLDFTSSSLQILFCLIVLSFYHSFYIAFSFALVLVLYIVFKPMIQRGFETSLAESDDKYSIAFWLQEIARADWSFRLTPSGNHSLKRLDIHTTEYLQNREKHFTVLWKQYSWMIAIKAIIIAALLGLGGYLIIDQQMNLGQFIAAEVLILIILSSVEKLIQLLETLYDVFTSLEKLGQVRDIPTSIEHIEPDHNVQLDAIYPIELIKVDVPSEPIITINKGDKLLLRGGDQHETTVLLRQLIDNSFSEEYAPRWNYRLPTAEQIAVMFDNVGWYEQGVHLFDGTVFENLLMGRDNISQSEIDKALRVVGLEDFVRRHLKGYDTLISRSTRKLTEKQRERLLVARALVHHPELLIMSMHGLALERNEIDEILQLIDKDYSDSTILCALPFAPHVNWKTINFNSK